jgi:hypothetical protein
MKTDNFKKLYNSKCERDSNSRHFWEKLGVVFDPTKLRGNRIYLVYRCSQCGKCIIEDLTEEFLE